MLQRNLGIKTTGDRLLKQSFLSKFWDEVFFIQVFFHDQGSGLSVAYLLCLRISPSLELRFSYNEVLGMIFMPNR